MKLEDLIIAVKEENLSKDQLENYRDQMSNVYARMQVEMAELEKNEALFLSRREDKSVAQRKISCILFKCSVSTSPSVRLHLHLKKRVKFLCSQLSILV